MGEIVRMDNGKDNEIMAIMNDASLCPLLEETKVGVSNYTKLPVTRLAALGTAFQPLTTAVQTAVTGAGGSGLYYVNTAGNNVSDEGNRQFYRFSENISRFGWRRTGSDDAACF